MSMGEFVIMKSLNHSQLVNANCRFVLKQNALTPLNINVNKPIPPQLIYRVFAPPQECPICLEVCEVPRMANCGHVMCFNCMAQHHKLSETGNLCAVCGEVSSHVPTTQLPVTFLMSADLPKPGNEVVLTLMVKMSPYNVALPVNQNIKLKNSFPPPNNILYTRVCEGNLDYHLRELSLELKTLIKLKQQNIDEFGDDGGFTKSISDLKAHIQSIKQQPPQKEIKENSLVKTQPIYFYQTSFDDFTLYTLSFLDMQILKTQFGDYDKLPTTLVAKCLNLEFQKLNYQQDKRMKFLNHLPQHSPIAFVDVDLQNLVSNEVYNQFKGKINTRTQRIRSKTKRELKELEKAHKTIEQQFKIEVAEAMKPHNMNTKTTHINTSALPSLGGGKSATVPPKWVDESKEDEEVLKRAYRSGKKIVLRF